VLGSVKVTLAHWLSEGKGVCQLACGGNNKTNSFHDIQRLTAQSGVQLAGACASRPLKLRMQLFQCLRSSSLPDRCLWRTFLDARVRTQADNFTEGRTLCFRLSEACPTLDDLSIDGEGLLR
jgi:hypothetical protein